MPKRGLFFPHFHWAFSGTLGAFKPEEEELTFSFFIATQMIKFCKTKSFEFSSYRPFLQIVNSSYKVR